MHNICKDFQDQPEDIYGYRALELLEENNNPDIQEAEEDIEDIDNFDPSQVPIDILLYETDELYRREGRQKRQAILDRLFPLN